MTRQGAGGAATGPAAAGPGTAGPGSPGSGAADRAAPDGGAPAAAGLGARAGGQRRQPWRAGFFALAVVAIVAGVAWALLDSRFFVVRTVEVTGTHLVTNAEVRSAAAIQPGIPLIRVNGAAVARRVEQLQQVQSAQVTRQWPDRVTISVTERTPALAVPSGTGYQLIDKYGVAVQAASRPPRGMPTLELPAGSGPVSSLRGSPAVFAAAVVIHELPRRLAGSVAAVQAPNASEVTVKLTGGITIVWGGTDRPAAKAAELAVLMRTHARTYDVSAPGTAVTGG
jgi:cell division protein FtsQ